MESANIHRYLGWEKAEQVQAIAPHVHPYQGMTHLGHVIHQLIQRFGG